MGSPPGGVEPPHTETGAAHAEQATTEKKRGRRGGRRRGKGAKTLRQINAAACERRDAWQETGHPNVTESKSRELDGLYGDLRGQRVELIAQEPALDVDLRVDRQPPRRDPGAAGGLLP